MIGALVAGWKWSATERAWLLLAVVKPALQAESGAVPNVLFEDILGLLRRDLLKEERLSANKLQLRKPPSLRVSQACFAATTKLLAPDMVGKLRGALGRVWRLEDIMRCWLRGILQTMSQRWASSHKCVHDPT